MPERITDEQLAEWERMAEAATPGPWEVGDRYWICGVNDGSNPSWEAPPSIAPGHCAMCDKPLVATIKGSRGENLHVHLVESPSLADDWHGIVSASTYQRITGNYDYEEGGVCSRPEDAHFIAAARTAVPALIAEVRRLRDLIRRMADELEERTLSQPLWPEIYDALGLDWEEHVREVEGEGARSDGWPIRHQAERRDHAGVDPEVPGSGRDLAG